MYNYIGMELCLHVQIKIHRRTEVRRTTDTAGVFCSFSPRKGPVLAAPLPSPPDQPARLASFFFYKAAETSHQNVKRSFSHFFFVFFSHGLTHSNLFIIIPYLKYRP